MSDALSTYQAEISRQFASGVAQEHAYRPALITLLRAFAPHLTVINEPRQQRGNRPDLAVQNRDRLSIGYLETKDLSARLSEAERTEQLTRYRANLNNLILTNYLEFRWYVNGDPRESAQLARLTPKGALRPVPDGAAAVQTLLQAFLSQSALPISTPTELAERMAALTRLLRDKMQAALRAEPPSQTLQAWRADLAKALMPGIDQPQRTAEFSDMLAQTLAYGLFSARAAEPDLAFSRHAARRFIPRTNPFLRDFFDKLADLSLDDEPYIGYVDDLADLLANADIESILANFGKRSARQDPIVHFYETFLAKYDAALREKRGVYYTPEPVVNFIVGAVDNLLRQQFNCRDGLAERAKLPDGSHRLLILDPACGTGTFLYNVIERIRETFKGNGGAWASYVREHLLPRLFGFELLMAPYAVAHFKLGMQLAGRDLPPNAPALSFQAQGKADRLQIYLTNALESVPNRTQQELGLMGWLTAEALSAERVKRDLPIMVVLGNPPYSGHSANQNAWIDSLLRDYYHVDGAPLDERNPKWLQDDYVKFIRFGQWRVQQSGEGILAFITNHGYLDNPTFRGMRQQLLHTFSEIYIIDLHGNAKKREQAPDGGKDENVFDIQQGVCIGIFVKRRGADGTAPAQVFHRHLWGTRAEKYAALEALTLEGEGVTPLTPSAPFYLFTPQDTALRQEYETFWRVTDYMKVNSVGIVTARDALTIQPTPEALMNTVRDFATLPAEIARQKYALGKDARDWKVVLAQADLNNSKLDSKYITPILYRPFDIQYTYYTGQVRGFICRPRREVMQHMLKENLALITVRQVAEGIFDHVFATNSLTESRITLSNKGIAYTFPLYLYLDSDSGETAHGLAWAVSEKGRYPNLSKAFIEAFSGRVALQFITEGRGDLLTTFGPEDVFHYSYAIFHSPTYRARYAEFLKLDFPRLPLPKDAQTFRRLAEIGGQLVALHLLEQAPPSLPTFPVSGDNRVGRKHPRYAEGRVYLNETQYFADVAESVWRFQIGGYQVAEKWLKDRRDRVLRYDEIEHYRTVLGILAETATLMGKIDAVVWW